MQDILVIITFTAAASYLLKKFVWNPIFEDRRSVSSTADGAKTKCGKNDCGCH